MSGLPLSQEVALALVPKFTAAIGIFCSSFLLLELIHDHRECRGNPMKRALFGVCCFEIVDCIGWFLSSWAMPAETGFVFATGTQGSCSLQGLFLFMGCGSPLFMGVLNYFFYLVVKNKGNLEVVESIEVKFLAAVPLYAIGSGMFLLSMKQFNPSGVTCWVIGSPPFCGNSTFIEGDEPCLRGEHAWLYEVSLFFVVLWCMIVTILYLNHAMRRILLQSEFSSEDVKWITSQAMLYSAAFLVAWTPSTVVSVLYWFDLGGFPLDLLMTICEPLQGFFNLLIFLRDRPESLHKLEYLFGFIVPCNIFLIHKNNNNSNNSNDSNRNSNQNKDVNGDDDVIDGDNEDDCDIGDDCNNLDDHRSGNTEEPSC